MASNSVCYEVVIVVTNRNSKKFIDISRMSLRSAFLGAIPIRCGKTLIMLLDDSSEDGSFNDLCDYGLTLSKQTGIDFSAHQLSKHRGHPYLLYYAYTKAHKCFNANYLFKIDNDFIITNYNIINELIDIIDQFNKNGVKVFSIQPAVLNCPRELYDKYDADSLSIKCDKRCFVGGVNRASVNGTFHQVDFNWHTYVNSNKLVSTLFTFSAACIYCIKDIQHDVITPFFPYLFRSFHDDVFAGIVMTRKGYSSFQYMKIGGIHFLNTSSKINTETVFSFFHNLVLLRTYLYGFAGLFSTMVTIFFTLIFLRFGYMRRILSLLEQKKILKLGPIEKHIINMDSNTSKIIAGVIVIATYKGFLNVRKYNRLIQIFYRMKRQELSTRTTLEKYSAFCSLKNNAKRFLCNILSIFTNSYLRTDVVVCR